MSDWDVYRNISGAGTTVVKAEPGILKRITINKAIGSSVITVYDNTAASGTKIATITEPAVLLSNNGTLEFGCGFLTGLTIVTSTSDDITVIYQ